MKMVPWVSSPLSPTARRAVPRRVLPPAAHDQPVRRDGRMDGAQVLRGAARRQPARHASLEHTCRRSQRALQMTRRLHSTVLQPHSTPFDDFCCFATQACLPGPLLRAAASASPLLSMSALSSTSSDSESSPGCPPSTFLFLISSVTPSLNSAKYSL